MCRCAHLCEGVSMCARAEVCACVCVHCQLSTRVCLVWTLNVGASVLCRHSGCVCVSLLCVCLCCVCRSCLCQRVCKCLGVGWVGVPPFWCMSASVLVAPGLCGGCVSGPFTGHGGEERTQSGRGLCWGPDWALLAVGLLPS